MDESVMSNTGSTSKEKCPFEEGDFAQACRYERKRSGGKEYICYSVRIVHVKKPNGITKKRHKLSFDFLARNKPVKYGTVAWHPALKGDTWHLESVGDA